MPGFSQVQGEKVDGEVALDRGAEDIVADVFML
jgi:hypothetical protein